TEDQAVFTRGGDNLFTLGNGRFQLVVGVIAQLIKRAFTNLRSGFGFRIIGNRRPDNAVVIIGVIRRIYPTQRGWNRRGLNLQVLRKPLKASPGRTRHTLLFAVT
ncbi:hypothetical protein ENTCAN_06085, partial [Enterobacter cancerogenus ATCC 35316]